MSRIIKFRAWDKGYKFMTNKVLVGNTDSKDENYTAHSVWIEPEFVDYECEPGWMNFDEHSNIILMQYTGLKDKNGLEIYEGDILIGKNYDITKPKYFIGVVEYDWNRFVVKAKRFPQYDLNTTLEVIGNIHQNQNLLESELND